jgi:serine/threonine-protein kinase RsbW
MAMSSASLTVRSDLENLSSIRSFIKETAENAGLPGEGVSQLRLAVDEACANIMIHGYRQNDGEITIAVNHGGGKMVVSVSDDAPRYNPLKETPSPDLEAPLDERLLGGMGVLLIKQNTDAVEYQSTASGGNVLILTKLMRKPGTSYAHE